MIIHSTKKGTPNSIKYATVIISAVIWILFIVHVGFSQNRLNALEVNDKTARIEHQPLSVQVDPALLSGKMIILSVKTIDENLSATTESFIINEVSVEITNKKNGEKKCLTTYMDGMVTFEITPDTEYVFILKKAGYLIKTVMLSSKNFHSIDRFIVNIPLNPDFTVEI